ncbi:MAG: SRPBCC family protein [Acidimicrobiia bacterium]|nr:SRPBCC family protein [Acidimicrobiia bacterium]NNC75956.1 cyclase [Acidimicrobiia bacterium]
MAAEGTVQSIVVDASPEDVEAVAVDLMAYPEWASAVKTVEVHEEDDEGRPARATFVTEAMIKEITYTLVYDHDRESGFSWEAEEGPDIRSMDGSYEFIELEDGTTEVVYALKVDPSFTVPGFLRRQAEKTIVSTALRGLKKRVEGA